MSLALSRSTHSAAPAPSHAAGACARPPAPAPPVPLLVLLHTTRAARSCAPVSRRQLAATRASRLAPPPSPSAVGRPPSQLRARAAARHLPRPVANARAVRCLCLPQLRASCRCCFNRVEQRCGARSPKGRPQHSSPPAARLTAPYSPRAGARWLLAASGGRRLSNATPALVRAGEGKGGCWTTCAARELGGSERGRRSARAGSRWTEADKDGVAGDERKYERPRELVHDKVDAVGRGRTPPKGACS